MNKNFKKTISIGLCTTMLSAGLAMFPLIAQADEAEDAAFQAQVEAYKAERAKRLEAIYGEKEKVSAIPAGNAYIPKDTIINVDLTEEISSKKTRKGDVIPLVTLDNVIINDIVVIPAGTTVNAKVTKATSAGMFGRAGKLEFTIDSVKTLNGIEIPLQYTNLKEAGSDDGAIAVVAFVSILGGAFMKGSNVSFPAHSKFAAKVTNDTDLKVKLTDLADAMNPDKPHGVTITIK